MTNCSALKGFYSNTSFTPSRQEKRHIGSAEVIRNYMIMFLFQWEYSLTSLCEEAAETNVRQDMTSSIHFVWINGTQNNVFRVA